jgi:hypothetical protein
MRTRILKFGTDQDLWGGERRLGFFGLRLLVVYTVTQDCGLCIYLVMLFSFEIILVNASQYGDGIVIAKMVGRNKHAAKVLLASSDRLSKFFLFSQVEKVFEDIKDDLLLRSVNVTSVNVR